MKPWTLIVHPAAARELADLPDREFDRVEAALERLRANPFRPRPGTDVKKLHGDTLYRLRVGERRVIYAIVRPDRTICVLVVEDREVGYGRLMGVAEARMGKL